MYPRGETILIRFAQLVTGVVPRPGVVATADDLAGFRVFAVDSVGKEVCGQVRNVWLFITTNLTAKLPLGCVNLSERS